MDEDSKQLIDDCFLRPISDPRSTNSNYTADPPPSKHPLKTELQVLRLSDTSQQTVMDTLRLVHGAAFQLGDASKYKDKGGNKKDRYWQERGNLVIQGGCDYSNLESTGSKAADRFRMYALLKLESYGFPKTHATEALEKCTGDIDKALELLFSKYFPVPHDYKPAAKSSDVELSAEELLEMRIDEKLALESIYEKSFSVKEENRVWQLRFRIDHMLAYSPSERRKAEEREKTRREQESHARAEKKKRDRAAEPCRNFLKGRCKYGVKCMYLHPLTGDEKTDAPKTDRPPNLESESDPNWFFLEIRFPANSKYPYEPPLVFLKTTCPDIPHQMCLNVTRRLLVDARLLAIDAMPSVYTISELVHSDQEIADFLANDRTPFLDPKRSLFHEHAAANGSSDEPAPDLPTHYVRGTNRHGQDGPQGSAEQRRKEDLNILRKFIDKQSQPAYLKMLKSRRNLPAWDKSLEILRTVQKSQVVVISGETGCGKSTQVPQFLLDQWLHSSEKHLANINDKTMPHVEIVCTQPRRISAIGVAERVADERNEKVGNTVGYQIRLENKISTSTRLTFCTTGILLRRLQSDPRLESVTHVIVDEVHERSEESDFLLLILKELLARRADLRVILMSATLNANLFSDYFNGAPVLEIPGRTFPVEQLFLEDILDRSNFVLEPDSQFCRQLKKGDAAALLAELELSDVRACNAAPSRSIRDENLGLADIFARYSSNSRGTCRTLYLMDPMRINPELVEWVLRYIVNGEHQWPRQGSILVFLPGLAEIQSVHDALNDSSVFSPRADKYILVPLHSTLSSEEQSRVFRPAPAGKRKIVLSTNIAETSVTIDDCVFVVDCGQMKEKRFDTSRSMESLELVWVSRANAMQRKGRAGRVMPGVAIHLFTGHRFYNHILSQPVPEIHRVPLEKLILRIKTLPNFDGRNVEEVTGATMEPPTADSISGAVIRLQDVGALDLKQRLTALGHHLAALPVDVRIGKLMLFGTIFQCVDSALTIAACLSHKSPFVAPFNKKAQADAKRKSFATCNSDHITMLKAYNHWLDVSKRSKYAAKSFADENYMSWKTLEMLGEIKKQFLELLISIGFIPGNIRIPRGGGGGARDCVATATGAELNTNSENYRLVSAILCAALYPNVVKVLTPEKSFTMSVGGAVPRLPSASELRFKTRDDGYVALHPSSINYSVGHFSSPFLVYQEKVKTSRIFIRDCTMVPLLALCLFSGTDIRIELHAGDFIIMLEDGWIMVKASSHPVAEMTRALRLALANLLEQKIRDPCLNLLHHETGRRLISTIVQLLTAD